MQVATYCITKILPLKIHNLFYHLFLYLIGMLICSVFFVMKLCFNVEKTLIDLSKNLSYHQTTIRCQSDLFNNLNALITF